MKSKKTTYFLILSVLVLWSFVGAEIFSIYPENESPTVTNNIPAQKVESNVIVEDYTLLLDYEDPFLISKKPGKRNKQRYLPKPAQKKQKRAANISCQYKGLLKKGNLNLAVLHFQGRDIILDQEKPENGLTLLKVFNDSILISYEGFQYTFHKKRSL